VVADVVAPPPSPVAYVAMGSVSHDHFLQLEEHLEEEEQRNFSMDDVSMYDIYSSSYLYLCKQLLPQSCRGKSFQGLRGKRLV